MIVAKAVKDLQLDRSKRIGFVPTMGAFHEGHLCLMRTSVAENDLTVVSLFVNPTQFGKGEDFEKYPRDLDRDLELAKSVGVDILFTPDTHEMYPRDEATRVVVPAISERWDGQFRPGHFDGVATIVCKLFNIIRPSVAYFGWKDLQQCLVIIAMVEDLNLPTELSFQDTIRESDGLARSSRNVYLSKEERSVAPLIYQELLALKANLSQEQDPRGKVESAAKKLTSAGFHIDYLALVDMNTLAPIDVPHGKCALIFAGRIGATRLIDNIRL